MKRRPFKPTLRYLLILFATVTRALAEHSAPLAWGDAVWQLEIAPTSGALVRIENKNDPQHMNWLREAGRWERHEWKPDSSPGAVSSGGQWGLVEIPQVGPLHAAKINRISDRAWESVYTSAALAVTVRRELDDKGDLVESYTFKNTGGADLEFPVGSVSMIAPFFDQYPGAQESLTKRCHAHLWMGGGSAWVNALRMGNEAPHLGLVLTQGRLDAYSQRGGAHSERGVFLLHPGAMRLKPNETATVAWRLFWHKGWDDFFAKLRATPGFVRLTAKDYVLSVGQPLEVLAESAEPLTSARVLVNGRPVQAHVESGQLRVSIPTTKPGDLLVELETGGRKSWLRAYVTPPIGNLIEARIKFIVRKQQFNALGDPLDGAYVSYDNETGQQAYNLKVADHNAGRERVAMGVLGALYLPLCRDAAFKSELQRSLQRYSDFLTRELENEDGVVFEGLGRQKSDRIYNFPWVAHFHLSMYRATGDAQQLDRFVRVIRAYYSSEKALVFYPIGIPVYDGIKALEQAKRTAERDELLGKFRQHADYFLKNGTNYPASEVNYEQSIVAPAVQMLAEMAVITGESRYLEGAKAQMPVLEAFAGKQPDSRLNEISIRHWDDFWFGKIHAYGDTMPHYWSSINALAYAYYGLGTKDASWFKRADAVLKGNLSLFTPEGTGSAAYLNAFMASGKRGERNDPLANDQDWALVNLLMVRALSNP